MDQQGREGKADLIIHADLPTHLVLNPDRTRRDVDIIIRMMLEPAALMASSKSTTILSGEIFKVSLHDGRHVHLSVHPFDLESRIKPTSDNPIAFENDVVQVSAPKIDFNSRTFTTQITFRREEEKKNVIKRNQRRRSL